VTEDVHTPTNAGPDQPPVESAPVAPDAPTQTHLTPPWSPPTPDRPAALATADAPPAAPAGEPAPRLSEAVPPSQSTFTRPAGSALLSDDASAAAAPAARPEVLVGGAFAGGFLAALILKRLGR
jgi:hypothetical protein